MKKSLLTIILLASTTSFAFQQNKIMQCGQLAVCSRGVCTMTTGDSSYFTYQNDAQYDGTYKLTKLTWSKLIQGPYERTDIRCAYTMSVDRKDTWMAFKTIPNTQWVPSHDQQWNGRYDALFTCEPAKGPCTFELVQ